MGIISSPFSGGLSWYNKKSRAGRNGATTTRKKMKTVRLGGSPQRAWRIKAASPKLRLKVVLLSPFKLLKKLKNAYLNMMVSLSSDGSKAFGEKRIPKARHPPIAYSNAEFDKRLVMEIYKSLVISRELATN